MPNGRGKGPPRRRAFSIDAREVEEEIRRNRASNEKFLREYSEWFERNSTKRPKKRPQA
jgi:hypothetical protein